MPFSCNMQLLYYPFDVQVCQIPVVMSSASVEYLHFNNLVVAYLGERMLTEVEVGEMSITSRLNTTQSTADVRVELKRRYAFHLTSTYLPTVLLIIVGYGTLYIRLAMLQVRSIMALTTLLVLTSLYTQTAASLPKTSYLKAIDVWLLYCITILVLIIIAHIFTDYIDDVQLHVNKVSPIGSDRTLKTSFQGWFGNQPIANMTITIMRVIVPLSFIIFNAVYWSFVRGAI
ncbi:glutamate-gated chloride channel alpha-like [Oratosquilla oratoria]|uniref:glutamate-gated chloride channel alpha-like n=1 Tax=Oratosquilla oratoria TaxID=337810 RepID=UPI003F76C647